MNILILGDSGFNCYKLWKAFKNYTNHDVEWIINFKDFNPKPDFKENNFIRLDTMSKENNHITNYDIEKLIEESDVIIYDYEDQWKVFDILDSFMKPRLRNFYLLKDVSRKLNTLLPKYFEHFSDKKLIAYINWVGKNWTI